MTQTDHGRYTKLEVAQRTFGYLWQPTRTVGLKQTLAEQAALVAERPEVFEVQFTAGGFGWVVVHLDGIERDELAELTFEAWRLSAPAIAASASAATGCRAEPVGSAGRRGRGRAGRARARRTGSPMARRSLASSSAATSSASSVHVDGRRGCPRAAPACGRRGSSRSRRAGR